MNKRGFTLIELMIAVVITSIVVLAAYTLMNAVTSNFNNEDDRVALRGNLRNAEMLIQRDLGRIGYRAVVYDGGHGFYVPSISDGGQSSDTTFQAFRHAKMGSFSQFTIVGDITDYGYFEIDRLMGTKVTIRPTTLSSIQTNDCLTKISAERNSASTLTCGVGYCNNCQDGSLEPNGAMRFKDAFISSFKNVKAVRFEPNTNAMTSDIRRITGYTASDTEFSLTLENDPQFPGDHNYAAMNIGDHVTPIAAITYTVMNNNGEYDLVRCMHGIDNIGVSETVSAIGTVEDKDVTAISCAIVLRNVDDFRIYPYPSTPDFNQKVTQTVATSEIDSATWNLNINQISSFMFHLSAHSTTPVKKPEAIYDADENSASYMPPFYSDGTNVFSREHVLGSALMYSRPERGSSSTATIYQGKLLLSTP